MSHAPVSSLEGFHGSWEALQNPACARILADHHRMAVIDIGSVLVQVRRWPLVGNMSALVAAPDPHLPLDEWWPRVWALGCSEITLHTIHDHEMLRPYRTTTEDTYSLVIDLRDGYEKAWGRIEDRCRRAIRKGERSGLTVHVTDDRTDLDRFYELLLAASDHGRRFEIVPVALLWNLLVGGVARLFIAVHDGEICGGAFYLARRSLFGWLSAFDRGRARGIPSNLLYWNTVPWGIEHGFAFVDLGFQSLSAMPEIALFKRSYGPHLVPACSYRVPCSRAKLTLAAMRARLARS